MSGLSSSPKVVKGGLVLVDPSTAQLLRVISLQYNSDTLTRSLQVQGAEGDGGNRSEALRLKGPAVETIKLEADIDATDQLEHPEQNRDAVQLGVQPQLALLETLLHPSSADLIGSNAMASMGMIEIVPAEKPLLLFVWSKQRVIPVRITDLSITEEAFDTALNPMRAKVNLGLRVLSVSDLGFDHKGGSLYLAYLQVKESLAQRGPRAELSQLGLGALP